MLTHQPVLANHVLADLPARTRRLLQDELEPVALAAGDILCEAGEDITDVYFPTSALVSLMAVTGDGKAIEVGLVGRAGVCGVAIGLGGGGAPARFQVQAAGTALRLDARRFRSVVRMDPALRAETVRLAHHTLRTAIVIAGCVSAHPLAQRTARALLALSDGLGLNSFRHTQRQLAERLGVRRPGVSDVAAEFQRRGLITYERGRLSILDRPALASASCDCYGRLRALRWKPAPRPAA